MKNHLSSSFFGLKNHKSFIQGIQQAVNEINGQNGIYTGDNLFTFHRNLSFLEDERFMKSFLMHSKTDVEKAIIWRVATVLWGFNNGLRLEGDFIERLL